jgi:RNA polymerase sigma-70 factor (ECF subfamily)
LRAAIARLPEDQRLVLVMVEYQGMSGVEVAKALDKPAGTVWRWLHEARAELRRTLERGKR